MRRWVHGSRADHPEVAGREIEHVLDLLHDSQRQVCERPVRLDGRRQRLGLPLAGLGLDLEMERSIGVVELGIRLVAAADTLRYKVFAELPVPRERGALGWIAVFEDGVRI